MPHTTDYSVPFDTDLLLAFTLEFSRFEYSLKRAGFLIQNSEDAKPDWDSFAVEIRGRVDFSDTRLTSVVHVLEARPPRKQIRTPTGELGWRDAPRGDGEAREAYLLRLVRIVRNNLFHGGKFPSPTGPLLEPARDRELVEGSLRLLAVCRCLVPRVDAFFREAA
jgi:hypothetical protein